MTDSHSNLLSELIVSALTSKRLVISIWLRIKASRGDMSRTGPLPRRRRSLAAMKYTKLLPHPVFWTSSSFLRPPPSTKKRMVSSWSGRNAALGSSAPARSSWWASWASYVMAVNLIRGV